MRLGRPWRRPVWIIWYAVLLHTLWGCLLLASSRPYGATALHVFAPVPRVLMAALLFLASALAAWGVANRPPSWRTLAALLPQQTILTVSGCAAVAAVVVSQYGDGVARPRLFILADQAPAILVVLLHTAAVVEMHARRSAGQVLAATLAAMEAETELLREKVAGTAHPSGARAARAARAAPARQAVEPDGPVEPLLGPVGTEEDP